MRVTDLTNPWPRTNGMRHSMLKVRVEVTADLRLIAKVILLLYLLLT
jgi:hypothetical protein